MTNKIVNIDLGNQSYDIVIGKQLISNASSYIGDLIPENGKVFIITDSNVAKLHANKLLDNLNAAKFDAHLITIPFGESSKNFNQLQNIIDSIFKFKPERKSTIIALGGGVVGDIAGFAASLILRGINFIQMPTTVLSMVDSSVGGKTAVNLPAGKNLVGSFYQPKLVLVDLDLLETLPEREWLSGYAEIVKYGLINDKEFFEFLEKEEGFSKINQMVEISCKAKANIVAQDEKETGIRALLNLGHTFGHALEAIAGYDGRLLHGEAVSIGMVLAFKFSEYLKLCPEGTSERVELMLNSKEMITKIFQIDEGITADKMIHYMYQDKKVSNNSLVFILAEDIGKSFIKKDVKETDLRKFLESIL